MQPAAKSNAIPSKILRFESVKLPLWLTTYYWKDNTSQKSVLTCIIYKLVQRCAISSPGSETDAAEQSEDFSRFIDNHTDSEPG